MVLSCGLAYSSYLWLRPVEIMGVHQQGIWTNIVVKNFPLRFRNKIKWWEENKSSLQKKYEIPVPDAYGNYVISLWDIGSGYRKDTGTDQDSDLLCFNDMKTKANCIEKNKVFEVLRGWNGGLQYR
ncbi:DUF943 family protein [Vibrio aerogenes]|uniref:DUF943 family protein n=1 Tax=Vibrio aerogenes TaxID=92172 RepID=UPI0021C2F730|nr:DUF943 family protein [Vibrio aerogenes]